MQYVHCIAIIMHKPCRSDMHNKVTSSRKDHEAIRYYERSLLCIVMARARFG